MTLVKNMSSILENENILHGLIKTSNAPDCVSNASYKDFKDAIDSLTNDLILRLASDFFIKSNGRLSDLLPQ
ncbi:hypothetical protein pCPXV0224 [Cowpox virus]|uniref:Uncharacterized protein n=1 Tax=Cowpox virus TaxID=10243 RepID=A0A212Q3J8_COWPX|nr:hypothetical protein pCPXV0224 [Cowpox virus]SNB53847.1 hypothetical protein pCPXV0224 [Cowpox virus]